MNKRKQQSKIIKLREKSTFNPELQIIKGIRLIDQK